ncbi:MAG: hypothetical protein AB4290_18140 [Spirulina sp.]
MRARRTLPLDDRGMRSRDSLLKIKCDLTRNHLTASPLKIKSNAVAIALFSSWEQSAIASPHNSRK